MSEDFQHLTQRFDNRQWRDIRRFGVGMVAALIRGLIDNAKVVVPTHDFRHLELASLALRIVAAGGETRTPFLFENEPDLEDQRIRSLAEFVHSWEVADLTARPTPRRVLACLEVASWYRDLDVDLAGLEATWRLLDFTQGRGLPDDQRDAFSAAWLAGQRSFAINRLLVPFARSSEGKAWLARTQPVAVDEPLNELDAMHVALARSVAAATTAGIAGAAISASFTSA